MQKEEYAEQENGNLLFLKNIDCVIKNPQLLMNYWF